MAELTLADLLQQGDMGGYAPEQVPVSPAMPERRRSPHGGEMEWREDEKRWVPVITDADRATPGAMAASALDPLNIPSALVGTVSPKARDAWREAQSAAGPVPQMVGGMAGGAMAVPRILAAAGGGLKGALALGGAAGSSDVVDEAGGGVEGAMGGKTLAKALLSGASALPLRAAAPVAAAGGTMLAQSGEDAQAQGIDRAAIARRMQSMTPDQIKEFQAANGIAVDGRAGNETIGKALELEIARAGRNSAEAEQGRIRASGEADAAREAARIRAQGEADAAKEAARIKAQTEAEGMRNEAASRLKASDARRPFLERNPEYSTYAPWAAGAAAAAVPTLASLLTRRAATAPVRQASRSVDNAVESYKASPSPMAARTAANAGGDYQAAASAPAKPVSGMDRALDVGTIGTAAALPTAAVMAPNVIDYAQQPDDSPAYKQAARQFTADKMLERLWGPTSMGAILAGTGRLTGDKLAQATINPAPKGSNLAQAKTLAQMLEDGAPTPSQTGAVSRRLAGEMTPVAPGQPATAGVLQNVDDTLRGTPRYRAQRADEEAKLLTAQNDAAQARRVAEQDRLAAQQDDLGKLEAVRRLNGPKAVTEPDTKPKVVHVDAGDDPVVKETPPETPGRTTQRKPASTTNQELTTSDPPIGDNLADTVRGLKALVKADGYTPEHSRIVQNMQSDMNLLGSKPISADKVDSFITEANREFRARGLPVIAPEALKARLGGTARAVRTGVMKGDTADEVAGKAFGNNKTLAVTATAGAAAGAATDKADAKVGDEVVKRMVNGKALEDMTPAELRNSGLGDDEIGPALDRVRKKAGARENGRTAADQIRALRDPSSPTGRRHPTNGQFVAAP